MRLVVVSLSLFLIFCVAIFFSSCGLQNQNSNNSTDNFTSQSNTFEASTTECSENSSCKTSCQDLFVGQSQLAKKCLKLSVKDARILKKVISIMKQGNWSAIQADDIEVLAEFDLEIWFQYADTNRRYSLNMLEWIAKTPEAANLLDDNTKILKKAFLKVGNAPQGVAQSAQRNEQLRDGIKQALVVASKKDNTQKTFLEVASLTPNDPAFKLVHQLLVESCDEDHFCVKKFYCDLDEDIVLTRLNHLKLADDAKPNGGTLKPTDCN